MAQQLRSGALLCILLYVIVGAYELPITVIIPSYNNEKFCKQNIESVLDQRYENYRVLYYNDASTDNTLALVNELILKKDSARRVTIINNHKRKGALANFYDAIQSLDDNMIIATLDGDDFFAGPDVLARINQEYQSTGCCMTYGQFACWPTNQNGFCAPFPDDIVSKNAYRCYKWVSSHLRTFKAGLFKRIRLNDLMYDGQFLDVTCDLAMMFPMLEMAAGRYSFISDVLYWYNVQNPISDYVIKSQRQHLFDRMIRTQYSPYEPLTDQELYAPSCRAAVDGSWIFLIIDDHHKPLSDNWRQHYLKNGKNEMYVVVHDEMIDSVGVPSIFGLSRFSVSSDRLFDMLSTLMQDSKADYCCVLSGVESLGLALDYYRHAQMLEKTGACAALLTDNVGTLIAQLQSIEQIGAYYMWQNKSNNLRVTPNTSLHGIIFRTPSFAKVFGKHDISVEPHAVIPSLCHQLGDVGDTYIAPLHSPKIIEHACYYPLDFDSSMKVSCYAAAIKATKNIVGIDGSGLYHFSKALFNKNHPLLVSIADAPRIPKIIHQVWIGGPVPDVFKPLMQSWIHEHCGADWKYCLWTDELIDQLGLYNRVYYDSVDNPGLKSDIARWEILYRFGGVYVDMDFECLKSLTVLHHQYDFYTALQPLDTGYLQLGAALVGAIPGHPILHHCIVTIKDDWNKHGIPAKTGPIHLTHSFFAVADTSDYIDIAFPASYFYPQGCTQKALEYNQWISDGAFAIHHWAKSWMPAAYRLDRFKKLSNDVATADWNY